MTHNEIIHQQLLDTIASIEHLEVIGYFLYSFDGSLAHGLRNLPDGTIEHLPPEPWWNINSQIWLRETHSSESDNTFDIPEYHRRFMQTLGDDYIEGTNVQESLVLYMPVDLRDVAVIEIEVTKPIP